MPVFLSTMCFISSGLPLLIQTENLLIFMLPSGKILTLAEILSTEIPFSPRAAAVSFIIAFSASLAESERNSSVVSPD